MIPDTLRTSRGSDGSKCLPSLCNMFRFICSVQYFLYEKVHEAKRFFMLCVADSDDRAR